MTQIPNKKNIERVLSGLGYKIETTKNNVNKNVDQVINLEREMNKRELLSLSYYSIGIVQHMVMDVVIGKVLTAVCKRNENKIKISDLEE